MRWLLMIVAALAVLWSGYWFVGAGAQERALAGWFEDRRADGWVAEHDGIAVNGFPNRFDTTISDVVLADPETGVAWRAPFFQILALSYRPNHVIAVWPGSQSVASPEERIEIAAGGMRSSLVFAPDTQLAVQRATMRLEDFRLSGETGWEAGLDSAILATRQAAALPFAHDIAFDAQALRLSEQARARLDPSGMLPDEIGTLHLEMTVEFDAPWDRQAIEIARPGIVSVDLDDLTALWGRLELRAAGELEVDAAGYPEGRITVRARNWREMLRIGAEVGLLTDGLAETLERGLSVLAGLSGGPDTLDAPLTMSNRAIFFGPIPLGPAPRLVLR